MSIEAMNQALDALVKSKNALEVLWVSHHANRTDYAIEDIESAIKALRAAIQQAEANTAPADPKLVTEVKPRPLSYSLDDYHRAPSEGTLHSTWQDKPHRLLYDLIAAVAYYAGKQPATPEPVACATPDGLKSNWHAHHVIVNKAALQMVRNALRNDVERGLKVRGEMLTELDSATFQAHPAPSVPAGYALVPVEPTPEMENAFRQAFTDQLHKRRNQWGRAKHTMSAEAAGLRAMLTAMLAAK